MRQFFQGALAALVLLLSPSVSTAQTPSGSSASPTPTAERLLSLVRDTTDGHASNVFRTAEGVSASGNAAAAIPELLRLLEHPQARIRSRASYALRGMRDDLPKNATDAFIRAMGDTVGSVRISAASSLGRLAPRDPRVVELMRRAVQEDPVLRVRVAASQSLVASGDPSAIPALARALDDTTSFLPEDPQEVAYFRVDLVRRIGQLDSAAKPALIRLVRHPRSDVRKAAERTLSWYRVIERRQPIIDVHGHEGIANDAGFSRFRTATEGNDVVLTFMSVYGDTTNYQAWHREEPTRVILGPLFPCTDGQLKQQPCFPESNGWPDLGWLRREYQAGRLGVMGEMTYVYYGIPPTDERLAPYFALAEELDIPVAVHMNALPRQDADRCCPNYNGAYSDPTLLEPILRKHPRLRIQLMHAANPPILEQTVAFVKAHPNVYVDMSPAMGNVADASRYEAALRAFLDAGIVDRIMLGSDGPSIRDIIETTEAVAFLTEEQKRGIYFDNAVRFFRLDRAALIRRLGAPQNTSAPRS